MRKFVLVIAILANYLYVNSIVRKERVREKNENLLKFFRDHPGY